MIARLHNAERIYKEVDAGKLDCVRISNGDGKGSFGVREGITPDQVCTYIRETLSDFNGEIQVEVWKKGTAKDERSRYILNCSVGAAGGVGAVGNGGMSATVERLMQANFDTRLEMERMKLQQQINGGGTDYTPQAMQLFGQLLSRLNGGTQPAPVAPAPVNGSARVEEEECDDDEADVFDQFAAEEPDAADLVEHFLKLKASDPAKYAQAKAGLKML